MPSIRTRVMKILDDAFDEVEPSGKSAILALEVQKLTVVPRQLIDDVRYLVNLSKDPDFDINDAKIAIMPLRRGLEELDQEK